MNVAEFKAYVQGVVDGKPSPDVELQLIKAAIEKLGTRESMPIVPTYDPPKPPPWAPRAVGGVEGIARYGVNVNAKTAQL